MTETVCGHCGESFSVRPDLVGGVTNCPRCGKATEVAGLNDVAWRLLQVGGVVFVAGVGTVAYVAEGIVVAVLAAAIAGFLLWLVSRLL